jgi:hypothetical protein
MQLAHDLFTVLVTYPGHEQNSDSLLVADVIIQPQLLLNISRRGICGEQCAQGRCILEGLRASLSLIYNKKR